MGMTFGPRRGVFINIQEEMSGREVPLSAAELAVFERLDLIYRSLCAMLYNYVPTSGHPGGSISSGRLAQSLVFNSLDYDPADPDREDADILSYAAGHKALGLYALWALRNEVLRIGAPELLPGDESRQLRLEDLLGFRKNPHGMTPLLKKLHAKALDGHPTPATPHVRLAAGASGVGLAASVGLAFGALDRYGRNAPAVHVVEGEGGMTPGRVSEAMAAAGTASLSNLFLHVDWNQASIDSNRVCRDGEKPGEYVQWNPMELAWLHDWNVIQVPDGMDFQQILAAQRRAAQIDNDQPTAVVYRTIKGWRYGIEGKASHGAGHKLCADGYFDALQPFLEGTGVKLPRCAAENQRCAGGREPGVMDACFWEALSFIRAEVEKSANVVSMMSARLAEARGRLKARKRAARNGAPDIGAVYATVSAQGKTTPAALALQPGAVTTLRGELGRALGFLNKASGGALLAASADLMGSTSSALVGAGFPEGFFNGSANPSARLLSLGGICEDAMVAALSGISTFGHDIGVGSSYGAFLAPLGHVAARLHAIGSQARHGVTGKPFDPIIVVCAHAGLKTGEDGPTHADPQPLQLLEGNFPRGTMITLTPWDPAEIWFLLAAALAKRPAVIAPFVTRPTETVVDRAALGLAPASAAAGGIYRLRTARGRKPDATLTLQGSEVAYAFIREALPRAEKEGLDLEVFYVASAELFDLLSPAQQEKAYPRKSAAQAMGITGFTLPTMHRWITSEEGRAATMHPFQKGHYLGSGQADAVMREAGLDGRSQLKAIKKFAAGSTPSRSRGSRT
jgi:transketolase